MEARYHAINKLRARVREQAEINAPVRSLGNRCASRLTPSVMIAGLESASVRHSKRDQDQRFPA